MFWIAEKISTPQLSENNKAISEGKLTLQNISEDLNSMKNGKTPGNDGLTKEFYVCFFEEMGSLLLKSLNHSYVVGELSTSQKQTVITLIEKKKEEIRDLSKIGDQFPWWIWMFKLHQKHCHLDSNKFYQTLFLTKLLVWKVDSLVSQLVW